MVPTGVATPGIAGGELLSQGAPTRRAARIPRGDWSGSRESSMGTDGCQGAWLDRAGLPSASGGTGFGPPQI
jgi:hypothetical protein